MIGDKYELYVHTYEEGGRVLCDRFVDLEELLEELYCRGLGDQIGKFMRSQFEHEQCTWEYHYDPCSVYIKRHSPVVPDGFKYETHETLVRESW